MEKAFYFTDKGLSCSLYCMKFDFDKSISQMNVLYCKDYGVWGLSDTTTSVVYKTTTT